jgi:hypothetical protein
VIILKMCRIDLFEGEAHLAHIFAKRRRNRAILTNGLKRARRDCRTSMLELTFHFWQSGLR